MKQLYTTALPCLLFVIHDVAEYTIILITPVVVLTMAPFHRPLPTHPPFLLFFSVQLRNKVCVILDVDFYVESFRMFWSIDNENEHLSGGFLFKNRHRHLKLRHLVLD